MESYNLGPNGSLVMTSDMVATRLDGIQKEVDSLNPDYVIDTSGQIELFAFRPSGQYFKSNFHSDNNLTLFIFDGILVSSPINYYLISLLAASIKLRLKTAQVKSLNNEKDSESSLLSKDLARGMSKDGFMQSLIAVFSVTMHGMDHVSGALARTP